MAMTSTPARACGAKKRNPTRSDAQRQLARIVALRGAAPSSYTVYQCRHCGCWHIGHEGRSGRRRGAG